MHRGFKTWAEKLALEERRILGLRNEAPLPASHLARFLDVTIIGPREILGIPESVLHHLLEVDSDSWSATTVSRNDCTVIINNISHSAHRQESNLMHELAHILCKHQPSNFVQFGNLPFAMRSYDPEQEEEAVWLGGCLQLPRATLVWAVRSGMNDVSISRQFNASIDLVKYRRQITGVNRQLSGYIML